MQFSSRFERYQKLTCNLILSRGEIEALIMEVEHALLQKRKKKRKLRKSLDQFAVRHNKDFASRLKVM